jgi:hypothetical protein
MLQQLHLQLISSSCRRVHATGESSSWRSIHAGRTMATGAAGDLKQEPRKGDLDGELRQIDFLSDIVPGVLYQLPA